MEAKKGILIAVYTIIAVILVVLVIAIVAIVVSKQQGTLQLNKILASKSKPVIAYYCGLCPVKFSPKVEKLGGSETAVVNLAKEWQNMGYQVVVFATVFPGHYDGVLYIDYSQFNPKEKMDHLVLWRLMGSKFMLPKLIKNNYKTISLDLHDNDPYSSFPLESVYKVDYIMLKSKYQKSTYFKKFKSKEDQFKIVPNGVTDIGLYKKNRLIKKDPKKLVYTSCYLRGLEGILKISWPLIIQQFPDAKLHLFYGMDLVDVGAKSVMKKLISSFPKSVIDHGRLDRSEVRNLCADAMIHFYPCVASCEIDCISVKETCTAGIVPVIPNSFVFPERAGIHFDGTPGTKEFFKAAADAALQLMKNPDQVPAIFEREIEPVLKETVFSWSDIARKWKEECFH